MKVQRNFIVIKSPLIQFLHYVLIYGKKILYLFQFEMDIEEIVDIKRSEKEEVQTSTESSISETMEKRRKRLHSSTMTAKRRAQMTGNEDFYEETGKLYCRPCCKIVDHSRQVSIERHKESDGHKRNILKKKKQITLKSTFKI